MHALKTETVRYARLRERLLEAHGDLDEDTLSDTLEGISDLDALIAEVVRSALDDEALADALKSRIDALRARLDRLKSRARAKRTACAEAMGEAGLKRLACEDMTISLRGGTDRVAIENEASVPAAFWRTPDPILDKRAISEALKSGAAVAGARLEASGPNLSVRVA